MVYWVSSRDQNPDSFLDRVLGVIHIGANVGQERKLYMEKGLHVLWVEPIPQVYATLVSNLRDCPNQTAVKALLYDRDGVSLSLNVADNEGASSSVLGLKEHQILWPDVKYIDSIEMITKTLLSLVEEIHLDLQQYNSIVLDTQGSELLILKGAIPLLHKIAYVKVEIPDFEAYQGCPMLPEFIEFMKAHDFRVVSQRAIPVSTKNRAYYDVTFKNIHLGRGR